LSYIVEHNRSGVVILDRDFKFLYVSQRYLDDCMIKEESIIGKYNYEVFPDFPQKWRDAHHKALMGEISSEEMDAYLRSDGSLDWIRWECRPWYDNDGSVGGIVAYTEIITKQVKLLEDLKEEEHNLRIAQEIAHVGSFDYHLASEKLKCSDEGLRICGITQKEFSGKMHEIIQFIHPDEREYALEISRKAITERKIVGSELRLIRKDGEERIIDFRIGPVFDGTGNYVRTTGTIQDITERKKTESELLYLSYHDSLTGLHNRRYFEDKLKELNQGKYFPITIAMADINGLKRINDSYGHAQGDNVLVSVARTFQQCCRDVDIIARLGGDEFGFIFPNTDANKAGEIFKDIRSSWPRKTIQQMPDSVTFGLSVKSNCDGDLSLLVSMAENDLFKNKLYEVTSVRHDLINIIMNALYEKSEREMMHSKRVSILSGLIASELGMHRDEISKMRIAGLVHDIGKIGTSEKVLNKPDKLDADEWMEIKKHPESGSRILASIANFSDLAHYILHHHERWDGKGYPAGIDGENIPVESRIIALADAFDAMTSDRTYRKGMTIEEAKSEIERSAGTQFDPKIVDIFLSRVVFQIEAK
jgi:diguanylate cyclase (GGDEF)-like protein/PAS domain S-box-containing protein/putative nucleotidyltransferase with HDIG domain